MRSRPPYELLDESRRVLLVGMGVTNRAVAGSLLRRRHEVVAVDDRADDALRGAAADLGVDLIESPGPESLAELVKGADLVVPTPGLPDHHGVFALADEMGRPVVSELDLAAVWDDRPVAAITGTNGKTTVVELAVDSLERSAVAAVAAGNIDVPLVTAIDDPRAEVFVVEASSFRLARTCWFSPAVGTWLNFAPDHLDVHADLAAYEAAKAALWERLPESGTAVANRADPVVMSHAPVDRRVVTFGSGGDFRRAGDDLVGPDGPFLTVDRLWRSLPHDIDKALAAAATVVPLGARLDAVAAAGESFSGLPHRIELVGEVDGSRYYDDSKATTPHATTVALAGFAKVVLIAGGRNKGIDLSALAVGRDQVAAVIAIGEAAENVAEVFAGTIPIEHAVDMDDAVARARRLASGGVPVLLSPGCASFDWYRNYRERGDDFARAVAELDSSSRDQDSKETAG